MARGGCRLVEHGFGIEIVAILQHTRQDVVNAVTICAQMTSTIRHNTIASQTGIGNIDALTFQFPSERC